VATLISGDDREVRREEIDDLPFSLIAPLRTKNSYIRHNGSILHSTLIAFVIRQ
jgi:hypothetical protein